MDRDRKSTGLKSLQGRIWEEGFRRGDLQGDVYADVPPALERWRAPGARDRRSSRRAACSAQKLVFESTPAGDLTPSIRAFFDTTIGPKQEPESYRRIAQVLGHPPHALLFVSDVAEELDAARTAGVATALCCRESEPPSLSDHPVVTTFAAVCP